MENIKTKDDVRNFFSREPNTGDYVFMMGFSSRITEDAWILLDDEDAKALLIETIRNLGQELNQKLAAIEARIE